MVGMAYDVASGQGVGNPGQERVGRGAARRRTRCEWSGAQFTRAPLTPAPTTQEHRGQELVYTFSEEMTLKAAEAVKMVLNEGAECMANRTYHVHPHTGDTWHYAFPGEDGMESIVSLP